MLMALANLDGSFTCTLFMPFEGENSFENLKDERTLVDFFAEYFPDTKDVIPDLVEDFFRNPTSYLVMTKCFPWTHSDKVALIGDSAHAIVPFYGYGMNAGFEDISYHITNSITQFQKDDNKDENVEDNEKFITLAHPDYLGKEDVEMKIPTPTDEDPDKVVEITLVGGIFKTDDIKFVEILKSFGFIEYGV